MRFIATPFVLRDLADLYPGQVLVPFDGNFSVGTADRYEERQSVEVDVENSAEALGIVWNIFQNLDNDRITPDRKRSLMTGDLCRLEDDDGRQSWWIYSTPHGRQIEPPHPTAIVITKDN